MVGGIDVAVVGNLIARAEYLYLQSLTRPTQTA